MSNDFSSNSCDGCCRFFLLKIIDWIAPDLSLKFLLNFVYAAFTESFYLIAVTALYGNDLQRRNPKSLSNKDQTPVLFIHGLYHNSSGWWKYLKIFQEAQIEPLFTMNLGSPFGSINQHAYRINEMVDHIQKVTGRKDIILVGHSMGGLAATKFALDLATEDTRVISIVTLGSPLKGTWVANYLGWGESVKEMRMNSPYALSLSEKFVKMKKFIFFILQLGPI
ncbi:MAG: alpha/beta fold hydrolase [Parachlamydiaceae bacterium]|nr:MAG: alpha/beta fold hydrolase [Parachlamydiaceae bacterium]